MGKKLLSLLDTLNTQNSILIDTPFLIYHLEDIKPYSDFTSRILDSIAIKNSMIFISIVSFTEILAGIIKQRNYFSGKNFKNFFHNNPFIDIVDFNLELSEMTAGIRSETGLGLADAIIIATAVKKKVRFLITNDLEFRKIKKTDFELILLDELMDK